MARKKTTKIDPADTAQKIWLAGLGALSVAEQEGSKFFKMLVTKGKERSDWAEMPTRTVKEARGKLGTTLTKLEHGFDERVQGVLHRIGVPTRDEIEALTNRVEALTRTLSKTNPAKTRRRTGRTRATKAA